MRQVKSTPRHVPSSFVPSNRKVGINAITILINVTDFGTFAFPGV
jgi:hypothetical protein